MVFFVFFFIFGGHDPDSALKRILLTPPADAFPYAAEARNLLPFGDNFGKLAIRADPRMEQTGTELFTR